MDGIAWGQSPLEMRLLKLIDAYETHQKGLLFAGQQISKTLREISRCKDHDRSCASLTPDQRTLLNAMADERETIESKRSDMILSLSTELCSIFEGESWDHFFARWSAFLSAEKEYSLAIEEQSWYESERKRDARPPEDASESTKRGDTMERNSGEPSTQPCRGNLPPSIMAQLQSALRVELPIAGSNSSERRSSSPGEGASPQKRTDVEENLWSLTVKDLKKKLRSLGLKVSGRKAELVDRLVAHTLKCNGVDDVDDGSPHHDDELGDEEDSSSFDEDDLFQGETPETCIKRSLPIQRVLGSPIAMLDLSLSHNEEPCDVNDMGNEHEDVMPRGDSMEKSLTTPQTPSMHKEVEQIQPSGDMHDHESSESSSSGEESIFLESSFQEDAEGSEWCPEEEGENEEEEEGEDDDEEDMDGDGDDKKCLQGHILQNGSGCIENDGDKSAIHGDDEDNLSTICDDEDESTMHDDEDESTMHDDDDDDDGDNLSTIHDDDDDNVSTIHDIVGPCDPSSGSSILVDQKEFGPDDHERSSTNSFDDAQRSITSKDDDPDAIPPSLGGDIESTNPAGADVLHQVSAKGRKRRALYSASSCFDGFGESSLFGSASMHISSKSSFDESSIDDTPHGSSEMIMTPPPSSPTRRHECGSDHDTIDESVVEDICSHITTTTTTEPLERENVCMEDTTITDIANVDDFVSIEKDSYPRASTPTITTEESPITSPEKGNNRAESISKECAISVMMVNEPHDDAQFDHIVDVEDEYHHDESPSNEKDVGCIDQGATDSMIDHAPPAKQSDHTKAVDTHPPNDIHSSADLSSKDSARETIPIDQDDALKFNGEEAMEKDVPPSGHSFEADDGLIANDSIDDEIDKSVVTDHLDSTLGIDSELDSSGVDDSYLLKNDSFIDDGSSETYEAEDVEWDYSSAEDVDDEEEYEEEEEDMGADEAREGVYDNDDEEEEEEDELDDPCTEESENDSVDELDETMEDSYVEYASYAEDDDDDDDDDDDEEQMEEKEYVGLQSSMASQHDILGDKSIVVVDDENQSQRNACSSVEVSCDKDPNGSAENDGMHGVYDILDETLDESSWEEDDEGSWSGSDSEEYEDDEYDDDECELSPMDILVCPLTHKQMRNPVIAMDGHTYEEEAIRLYVKQHGTSPITRDAMPERFTVNRMILEQLAMLSNGEKGVEKQSSTTTTTTSASSSHPVIRPPLKYKTPLKSVGTRALKNNVRLFSLSSSPREKGDEEPQSPAPSRDLSTFMDGTVKIAVKGEIKSENLSNTYRNNEEHGDVESATCKRSSANRPYPSRRDSLALTKRNRDVLVRELLDEFNADVFDNLLPSDLSITFNARLLKTAGKTRIMGIGRDASMRTATVEISTKVIDSYTRLRNTLAHELCHVAAWLIDGVCKPPHGPVFMKWAKRAAKACDRLEDGFYGCHNYRIVYKFVYRCSNPSCALGSVGHDASSTRREEDGAPSRSTYRYVVQRHSRAKGLQCRCCRLPLQLSPHKSDGSLRKESAYNKYVSDHYSTMAEANPSATKGELMKMLSIQYKNSNNRG